MINQQVTQYQWIFAPKSIEGFQVCQSMKHSLKISNVSIDCNNDLKKNTFFSLTLSEGKRYNFMKTMYRLFSFLWNTFFLSFIVEYVNFNL